MLVISRGNRIRYQAFGAGPVVVVLLHGYSMWGGRWVDRGYVSGLQDRFRVIVPDLLGHGDSDKPHDPAAYGNPNIATDVLAVLNAEGVNSAHLWGYSWGVMIAESLAAACPERALSLVLGGFPAGLDSAQRAALQEPSEAFPASLEEMFADWPPALAEAFIARNDFGALVAVRETLYTLPTTVADLHAAARPILAYYGAEDTYLDLARNQAVALSCHFEAVPGDHVMAFAQTGNILPAAIAHFEAAQIPALAGDQPPL